MEVMKMNVREASQEKVDQIIAYIMEQIESGEWSPGHRMPTEKQFIEQFSAARNTVRKALAKLEDDNLIIKHVGRGTFIKDGAFGQDSSSSEPSWHDASPAEINEIRVLLEPSIADLVVARATASDIAYAQECLAKSLKAKTIEDYEHWDAELHATIIKASRNNMLTVIYNAIHKARQQMEWHEIKRRSLNEQRMNGYNEDHTNIVDALCRRDAVALRKALGSHLKAVSHNMLNPPLS